MMSWLSILPLIYRIKSSTLFSSQHYLTLNPDIGRFPPILHWVKFGQHEDRKLGAPPLSLWLLPLLMENKISPAQARYLSKISKNHPNKLAEPAAKLGLNINDFLYHQAMHNGEYDKAYEFLNRASQNTVFDGAYEFATRHMQMGLLPQAQRWARAQSTLSLERSVKLSDMSRALGMNPTHDTHRIISALSKTSGSTRLDTQIFTARLPVLETGSETCRLLKASGLLSASPNSPGRAGEFARETEDFWSLINLATYNALFSPPRSIARTQQGNDHISALEKANTDDLKIRLLIPHYWVSPQSTNAVTGSVLELHKQLISEELNKGRAIFPIMATHIFDITDEQNWGMETLSYHSISRGTSAGRYRHYKESYLPGFFSLDPQGYSGWSSLSTAHVSDFKGDATKARIFHQSLYKKYVENRITKYSQALSSERNQAGSPLPKTPYLFVALQIPNDTVAYWSHMPTRDWIKHACDAAKMLNIPVVIKIHPKDKSASTQLLISECLQWTHVSISTESIHTLIAGCVAVITTNSGVGFEALLHHKAVINCGRSDYTAVTTEVKTKADIQSALHKIADSGQPYSPDQINAFLYRYCLEHCYTMEAG